VNLLHFKEADVSALENEARQIVTEGCSNDDGRMLHQQTQSIRSNMATLLQLVEDQMLRLHQATSSNRGIVSEIRETVVNFEKNEKLIGRRPLLIEAESIDDEISHITLLRSQIYAEADNVMSKVDEQRHLYAEVSDGLPAEIQQAVDELASVKTRVLVRVIDISQQLAYLTSVDVKLISVFCISVCALFSEYFCLYLLRGLDYYAGHILQ